MAQNTIKNYNLMHDASIELSSVLTLIDTDTFKHYSMHNLNQSSTYILN